MEALCVQSLYDKSITDVIILSVWYKWENMEAKKDRTRGGNDTV